MEKLHTEVNGTSLCWRLHLYVLLFSFWLSIVLPITTTEEKASRQPAVLIFESQFSILVDKKDPSAGYYSLRSSRIVFALLSLAIDMQQFAHFQYVASGMYGSTELRTGRDERRYSILLGRGK